MDVTMDTIIKEMDSIILLLLLLLINFTAQSKNDKW